jgi:hypothetical protein
MADDPSIWWNAPKGEAYKRTLQFASGAESELSDVFERLFRLECLYDPNNPDADRRQQDRVTENGIASSVDTVHATIAITEIWPRFDTDGGDFEQQSTARKLGFYSEDLGKRFDVLPKCRKAFKEATKKGKGLVKVHEVFGEPRVEQIMLENVVVPPDECRDGRAPRQWHHWDYVDADELAMRFPKAAENIEKARKTGRRRRYSWGRLISNDVECLWSYRLPIGVKGKPGYKPGRVTLVIEGRDLLDKPYEKTHFPVAEVIWSERPSSYYPISLAERLMGLQRALNRNNWHIEKGNDNIVAPPIYVRPADINIGSKENRQNGYTVYRADMPQSVQHVAVSNETYQRNSVLSEKMNREAGLTAMATQGAKPAGIDSGIALREFKDQTTQRHADPEQAFEHMVLKVYELLLDVCKDLGKEAPKVTRRSRFGKKTMEWKDVDMGEVRVMMSAASNLNRTHAGRMQLVMEFAQAGIISTDQARKLFQNFQNPDLEREISLYTAVIEVVELDLDEIRDGGIVMPDPMTNLEICKWRAQREYAQWLRDKAPEDKIEALRQYIVQSVWMGDLASGAANANAAPAMPGAVDPMAQPGMAPPGMDPNMMPPPMGDPMAAQPQAALAAQAMQLRAG